ncbi:MAG: hypothetical protein KGI41_00140 [Patescibacteria group bacterium]|nr:hypothetical protein [Patescibacteria group bacterium]MDE1965641.1 hypothetical protein [Patescibacteria group bacterium]
MSTKRIIIAIAVLAVIGYFFYAGAGWAIADFVLIALIAASVPFILPVLAKMNAVVTSTKEGTGKFIMIGGPKGRVHHMIANLRGFHVNDPAAPWYEEAKQDYHMLPNQHGDEYYDYHAPQFLRPLLKHLGLYWVGWPWQNYAVYVYDFDWNELVTDERGHQKLRHRVEKSDFGYLIDFPYVIVTPDIETKGGESDKEKGDEVDSDKDADGIGPTVDMLGVYPLQITNLYRAFFETEDWLTSTSAAIIRASRNYGGARTYSELKTEVGTDTPEAYTTKISDLNRLFPGQAIALPENERGLGAYGVKVKISNIQNVELSAGASAELGAAVTRKYVARQEAGATRIEADAKAYATRAVGAADADAERLRGKAKAFSNLQQLRVLLAGGNRAVFLEQLNAMRNPSEGEKIIWANNPFVKMIPGLGEALEESGAKTPEDAKAILSNLDDLERGLAHNLSAAEAAAANP